MKLLVTVRATRYAEPFTWPYGRTGAAQLARSQGIKPLGRTIESRETRHDSFPVEVSIEDVNEAYEEARAWGKQYAEIAYPTTPTYMPIGVGLAGWTWDIEVQSITDAEYEELGYVTK